MLTNKKKFLQSNLCDVAFTDREFDNFKKALEKFCIHDVQHATWKLR